jgi:cytochrome P450
MTQTENPELPFYPEARQSALGPARLDVAARESVHHMRRVRIWDGSWAWLVGSYEGIRQILTDERSFSADVRNEHYPTQGPAMRETQRGLFIRWDGDPHQRVRRILLQEFGPKAIATLRSDMERIVSRQIDELLRAAPPADLNTAFSLTVPTAAICHIMGVRYEEREVFQQAALAIVSDRSTEQQVLDAVKSIETFIRALVWKRMHEPRAGNLLSRLVHDFVKTGQLSIDELVNIGWVLVVAGHETTTHAINLSVLGFLLWPDQLAEMRRSRDFKRAVEEQLRFWTITQTEPRRVAIRDVEIQGQLIRQGEGVIAALPAANRDPGHFLGRSSPEKLDVTRDPQQMLTFGIGYHSCLGQGLARLELEIVYEQLFDRIPALRLAVPFEELRFHEARHQHGVDRLPVTW